jgi:xanthosine utilization system XapX-like protein
VTGSRDLPIRWDVLGFQLVTINACFRGQCVPNITGNPPKESVVLKAKADTNVAQR